MSLGEFIVISVIIGIVYFLLTVIRNDYYFNRINNNRDEINKWLNNHGYKLIYSENDTPCCTEMGITNKLSEDYYETFATMNPGSLYRKLKKAKDSDNPYESLHSIRKECIEIRNSRKTKMLAKCF